MGRGWRADPGQIGLMVATVLAMGMVFAIGAAVMVTQACVVLLEDPPRDQGPGCMSSA